MVATVSCYNGLIGSSSNRVGSVLYTISGGGFLLAVSINEHRGTPDCDRPHKPNIILEVIVHPRLAGIIIQAPHCVGNCFGVAEPCELRFIFQEPRQHFIVELLCGERVGWKVPLVFFELGYEGGGCGSDVLD